MIDQSTVYSKVLGIGSQCEIFRAGVDLKKNNGRALGDRWGALWQSN